jgi:uncharacterized protein (DUF305 family)
MPLFSRTFIRKQAISLATSMSVTATSLALAQDPKESQESRALAVNTNEQQLMFENDLAVSKMSREMLARPTGDVDRDFAGMMIARDQGAIDMARAELKYGRNDELRRLARNIVAGQQRAISAMQRAIGATSPTEARE